MALAAVCGAAVVATVAVGSRTALGIRANAAFSGLEDFSPPGPLTVDTLAKPQTKPWPCQVFWQLKVTDMVAQGWGSRALHVAAFYQRYHLWADECTFYIPEWIAAEWESWGMQAPFERMTRQEWTDATSDPSLLDVDHSFQVFMHGPWQGEPLSGDWTGDMYTKNLIYGDMSGCWDESYTTVLKNIFARLLKTPGGFTHEDYIGLHIRHGDKKVEGPLASFAETIGSARKFSNLTNIFLATDDASVVLDATQDLQAKGFKFNYTHYERTEGGEPKTCKGFSCHHDSRDIAVRAVIDDTLALAKASVLVGSWNSNFFRLAWLLNWLRRTEEQRKEDWCRDVMTGLACGNRQRFVWQFVERSADWSLVPKTLLPAPDSNTLTDCSPP